MALSNKQMQLLHRIIQRTESGMLKWQQTENDSVFQVSLGDASMRIRESGPDLVIDLYNSSGVLVESMSDPDADASSFAAPEPYESWYRAMQTLYDNARRSAFGADKLIDDLLKKLD